MRFSAIHKLSSYLMILAAVFGLLFSPEISFPSTLLPLVAIALSWFAEPSRFRLERYTFAWNLATVAVFLYLITDVLLSGGPVLISGARFLLFVLINKLFNRRSSKDYQQAYVISFLILVVATTVNTNISYAVCFILFVLFGTWTLTLLHLRREMEENYLLKHSDGAQSEKVEVERILNSRRIVGGPFLAGTSVISIGIILLAVLIFILFPRIGFGLFLGHRRGGVAMVGFSERVELGHHGVVRDNPQVVMRAVLPAGRPAGLLRWRGSAFDHYADGVWSHGTGLFRRTRRITPVEGVYLINHAPNLPLKITPSFVRRNLLRQEIYLEPLDSTVVFAADRPVALQVPRPAIGSRPYFVPRRGPLGEIRGAKMRTAGVHYTAYSHLISLDPAQLRRSPVITDPRWSHFLQLHPSLPRRIGDLSRRLTRDAVTVYDKVRAIQRYLRSNYRYTLKLTHDPKLDPVDEFLFVSRRGHCEYFASAMTLMLRHVGIHARHVNGFAGGEWNEVGQYIAVRQGDAHAWVEVLFANLGWVTFDPTPPGAQPTAARTGSWRDRISQFWDTLRLRWFRYVVEYDLGKQAGLLQGMRNYLRSSKEPHGEGRRWRYLMIAAALLLVAAIFLYLRRRRKHKGGAPSTARAPDTGPTTLYRRLLKLLARRGHEKAPGVTPEEFVAQLARSGFGGVLLVEQFTRCYYELRYGGQTFTPSRSEELGRLLRVHSCEEGAKHV